MFTDLIKTNINSTIEKWIKILFQFFIDYGFIWEESSYPGLDKGSPSEFLRSQVNHTTTRDGSWRSYSQVLNFEENSHWESELDSLTISKAESHIIIKHSVHVFDPECINRSIENDPRLIFTWLLGSLSHNLRGKTIMPLLWNGVDFSIELSHWNRLRVENELLDNLEIFILRTSFSKCSHSML